MDASPPPSTKAWPWATVAVALAALLAFGSSQLAAVLIYERTLVFSGQLWRLWTGHIVHFGPSHLLWDLAVFFPAGCWLERINPRCARWLYLFCPFIVSLLLLAFDPALERYAGLSGLAIGTLTLLAVVQLATQNESPWLWRGVLLLIAAKLVFELRQGAPLLVNDFTQVRNVPLAHLGGVGCGLLFRLVLVRGKNLS